MTDFPTQHNLDDELLSAYLDGELSDSERAAVEARLALDPAAQELLDQLRSVSRALQNLPTETIGADLSEAIRRRVELKLTLPPGVAPVAGSPLPLTLGEARREGISLPLALGEARREGSSLPLPLGEGWGEGESPSTPSITSPLQHAIDSTTNSAHPLPWFSVGQTRRGWVWASLAAAAALWIMVFQSDREANEGGPLLAQRGETNEGFVANETRSAARPQGELELRALDELPERSSSDLLAEHDAATRRGREITGRELSESSAAVPAGPAAPAANDDLNAAEPALGAGLATSTPNAAHFAGGRGGVAASGVPATDAPPAPDDADQLVVVRVLAKQSALQNKAFDQVLASNGIALDEPAAVTAANETQPAPALLADAEPADRFTEHAKPAAEAEQVAQSPGPTPVDEEAVLVEASPTALFACIESINQDSQNFAGVAVDVAAANVTAEGVAVVEAADESHTPLAANAKQRASDLGLTRFNRGVVPKQQRTLSQDTTHFYFRAPNQNDPLWRELAEAKLAGSRGGYGGAAGHDGRGLYGVNAPVEPVDKRASLRSLDQRQSVANSMGRAVRLQAAGAQAAQTAAGKQPARRVAAPADGAQREEVLSSAAAVSSTPPPVAADDSQRLQVLFLLSTEEATPSPLGENRAE